MRTAIILGAMLVACGGSQENGGAKIDPALAGTWNGTTTVTIAGLQPSSFASSVTISVAGSTATVENVCPHGPSSLTASGSGESIAWAGAYVCPDASFVDCARVTFTLLSGSLTLGGGALSGSANATGAGCGVSRAATFAFQGTKP